MDRAGQIGSSSTQSVDIEKKKHGHKRQQQTKETSQFVAREDGEDEHQKTSERMARVKDDGSAWRALAIHRMRAPRGTATVALTVRALLKASRHAQHEGFHTQRCGLHAHSMQASRTLREGFTHECEGLTRCVCRHLGLGTMHLFRASRTA